MASQWGLTAAGLVIPSADDLFTEAVEELRPSFGASYAFDDSDPLTQVLRTLHKQLASAWQAASAAYASRTRAGSSGEALASVMALTGTPWPEAMPSLVTLTLTGTPLVSVPAGSAAKASSGSRFTTLNAAQLVAVAALSFSTAYVVGDRVFSDGGVYQVTTAGTSASSGVITSTAASITHGTMVVRWLGEGSAVADAKSRSELTGPIVALAGDITEIDTPVGGWDGVVNLADAKLGRNEATDGEARLSAEDDIFRPGATTFDAIYQSLRDIRDVTAVDLLVNDQDVTDGDGVPGHSVEAIVVGGDAQVIVDVLRQECAAAGIKTYGNTSGTSYNLQGQPETVYFTRVVDVNVYVTAALSVLTGVLNASAYPTDGNLQVARAIVRWGNALPIGHDVVAQAAGAQTFAVPGVITHTSCNIGTAPSPSSSTTIAITRRQRAVFDTSRITITTSPGSV